MLILTKDPGTDAELILTSDRITCQQCAGGCAEEELGCGGGGAHWQQTSGESRSPKARVGRQPPRVGPRQGWSLPPPSPRKLSLWNSASPNPDRPPRLPVPAATLRCAKDSAHLPDGRPPGLPRHLCLHATHLYGRFCKKDLQRRTPKLLAALLPAGDVSARKQGLPFFFSFFSSDVQQNCTISISREDCLHKVLPRYGFPEF